MKTGTILQVQKYNKLQEAKWKEDCENHNPSKGGRPQLAFYVFSTNKGNYRKSGFVLKTKRGALLFKTKKEAIKNRL
jgi:hypothetical protein